MARHCSWCSHSDHNRVTCPDMTEYYRSLAIKYRGGVSFTDYAALYTRRSGLDLDGNFVGKPKKYRARTTIRRCSWCSESTHNKSTCPERALWLRGKAEDNEAYRYTIQERAKSLKIGVGSLLKSKRWFWLADETGLQHYNQHEIIGLVEKIDWDGITCDNRSSANVTTINWVNCPTDDAFSKNGMGRRETHGLLSSLVRPDNQWNAYQVDEAWQSANPTAGMCEGWVSKRGSKFKEPKRVNS